MRITLALLALSALGCASEDSPQVACHVNADCPANQACVEGACRAGCRQDEDCAGGQLCAANGQCMSQRDGGGLDDVGLGDPTRCVPNGDGRLDRGEFTLAPGAGAPFVTRTDAAGIRLALAGVDDGEGGLRWSIRPEGETQRSYSAIWSPDLFPAGAYFPTASYATTLPASPGLIAFFELSATRLRILGLADARGEQTRLTYDPPLDVLRFPLEVNDTWTVSSRVVGLFLGAEVELMDQATTRVRAVGRLDVPAGALPAIQIITQLERTFERAGFSQIYTEVDFLSECGGFIARAVSHEGVAALPEVVGTVQALGVLSCAAHADCGQGGRCNEAGYCEVDGIAPVLPEAACAPNGDGVISDAEMPVQAGLGGLFRINDPEALIPVDLAGVVSEGGVIWDFTSDALGALERVERTLPPQGFWFAPHFPTATYVGVLDAGLGMLAVFQRVDGALNLLGVASERAGGTLLIYDTPVPALRFPLRPGDHWAAQTAARGQLEGAEVVLEMRYSFEAGAAGIIQLPAGDVPVIPLSMIANQQVEGAPFAIQRRTTLFMAECLGGVARVVSQNNETEALFTQAAEVARLTIPRCISDLQCPLGATCGQGRCEGGAPPPNEDAGGLDDGGAGLDGGPEDAASGQDAGIAPDSGAPLCDPSGDGVLRREEFLLEAGSVAHFLVADGPQTVDLAGENCAEGRCWDLSAPREGDARQIVELFPVEGAWYAEEFPDASYASLLERERRWLGVFRLSDEGLDLLGTASETPRDMLTTYDPPVRLYQFPLQVGDSWVSESTQMGYWGFSSVWTEDVYTVQVVERGQMTTPQGPFPALQVITTLDQSVPFTIFGSDQVIHTFLAECFGVIARIVGPEGETEAYFNRADRVERLMPAR
ncbi:hypothetical protein KKF91_20010 [Myxococcota bacterium]|nr:hypothetical protein [Myxococcota bacterium]